MDEAEAQRVCGQCHREVALSNLTLHEMHCRRFLSVCPDCQETVPREQLEQHREEQHTLVRCSQCNKKVECCYLSDHESEECEERLQKCDFCELELPWGKLQDHSLACGSRTELCRDCGHYVTLRNQRDHGLTCSAYDQVSPPPTRKAAGLSVTCSRCTALLSVKDQLSHEATCRPAAETDEEGPNQTKVAVDVVKQSGLISHLKSTSLSNRGGGASRLDGEDSDQISTCPHCHLALPLLTLRWHQAKCQRLQSRK